MSTAMHITARLSRRRKPDYRGVIVALLTTVVVNGALVILLTVLERKHPPAAEEPVIIHRLTAPPRSLPEPPEPPEPVVRAVRSATTPASTPVPALIPVPPLPALVLSPLAHGAPMLAPTLPRVDSLTMPGMPTVIGVPAAGEPGSAVGAVADANAVMDESPVLVNGFDLERFYPRSARLRGIEGTSTMRLEVGVDGTVEKCSVIAGTPPQLFDAAAQSLGLSLRYSPGRVQGVPVSCTITQTVAWRLPR